MILISMYQTRGEERFSLESADRGTVKWLRQWPPELRAWAPVIKGRWLFREKIATIKQRLILGRTLSLSLSFSHTHTHRWILGRTLRTWPQRPHISPTNTLLYLLPKEWTSEHTAWIHSLLKQSCTLTNVYNSFFYRFGAILIQLLLIVS